MAVQTSPERWQRRFFTIWTGQAFSLFGSNVVQFALIWWLTATTGSATVLALASLAGMLPHVLVSPLAGTLVDRWNRRAVMMASDSLIALMTLLLVALFASGAIQYWHVLVLMAVRSAAGAFHYPAMTASTTLMVPEKHYARVAGVNQALQGAMSIVGPLAGAFLLARLPMQGILLIDVITALMAVVPLLFIAVPQPERKEKPGVKTSVLGEFLAGLRYVRAWPGMLTIVGLAMLLNFLLTPAFSLLPILVTRYLERGVDELALLNTAIGIGVLSGGLLLGVWGGFRRRMLTSMLGIFGIGVGSLLMGVASASTFVVAIIGIFIGGLMQPIANGPLHAIMQSVIAPDMQGRVFALLSGLSVAMTPVSLLIAGPVADVLGVRVWYILAGLTCMGVAIYGMFLPRLINLDQHNGTTDETETEPLPETAEPQEPAAQIA